MKRKVLSFLFVMTMGMSLLTGCGKGNDSVAEAEVNQNVEDNNDVASEEVDLSFYEEMEVTTAEGKSVKIYYDPEIIESWYGDTHTNYEAISNGNSYMFRVEDYESAEEFRENTLQDSQMEDPNAEATALEELQMGGHTVYSFQHTYQHVDIFNDELVDSNTKYGIIELDSDVVFSFCIFEEKGSYDELLGAIKFTLEQNKSDSVEANLQTYEFPAAYYREGSETGILTYNGDFVKFTDGDEHFSSFDLMIKNDGSYTFNVTLYCQSDSDAESYYQDRLDNLGEYDVSELKETVINDIPIRYFTYVKKTDGDSNKFLNCMIDFTDNDYKSRVVICDMFLMLEEEVMLTGLENFFVDIEIEGIKPGAQTEDSEVGNGWPVFLPERPEAFEVLEVTVDQENNATHYNIDVELVDYQIVKDYVDEIKNAGCDLENGHEKYSEEGGYIAFEGVIDNHIITVYYDVEWNVFEIIIGE